jgi:hypothetical protein
MTISPCFQEFFRILMGYGEKENNFRTPSPNDSPHSVLLRLFRTMNGLLPKTFFSFWGNYIRVHPRPDQIFFPPALVEQFLRWFDILFKVSGSP